MVLIPRARRDNAWVRVYIARMKLHFLGAAESVTGSCYVLEMVNSCVMIVCILWDCSSYDYRFTNRLYRSGLPPDRVI